MRGARCLRLDILQISSSAGIERASTITGLVASATIGNSGNYAAIEVKFRWYGIPGRRNRVAELYGRSTREAREAAKKRILAGWGRSEAGARDVGEASAPGSFPNGTEAARRFPVRMITAPTNKCLARCNKSRARAEAINGNLNKRRI